MNKKIILISVIPLLMGLSGCGKTTLDDNDVFDYIFTAQPVVASTNSTIFRNVQTDFAIKSNNKKLTQASVFVRNDVDINKATSLLTKLKTDIESGINNPDLIAQGISSVGAANEQTNKFGVPGAMAKKVTADSNGFSLGFIWGNEIKDDISSFVNLLTNNTLGEVPDDVYFTPSTVDEETNYDDLKILAPTGAPSVAFYNFATNNNFTTTSNPQEGLIPQFKSNVYDIIAAPTQGGLTQIMKQNAAYKLAATITFGNFYIVATGNDNDGILNDGDKVLIFQENDIPGKVFKYTYGDLKLDLTAVNAVSDTKLVIENGGVIKE